MRSREPYRADDIRNRDRVPRADDKIDQIRTSEVSFPVDPGPPVRISDNATYS